MSNSYKVEALAGELASILAVRTGKPTSWALVSGTLEVTVGYPAFAGLGGVTIQVKDQRGNTDGNWDALPGFGARPQPVYTTGVATVITESNEAISGVEAAATETLTIGNGADSPFAALGTIDIAGVTLTEGTDFAAGATDATSATAIANAINNHPALSGLVVAAATLGGALADSTVDVTALATGLAGNGIGVVSSDANAQFGAATLSGGTGGTSTSNLTPPAVFMAIWGELAKRGVKMEFYQTAVGTAPISSNTSYKQSEFFPNAYWPLSGLV